MVDVPLEYVQVGAADPHALDAPQHLAGAGRGLRRLALREPPPTLVEGCLHDRRAVLRGRWARTGPMLQRCRSARDGVRDERRRLRWRVSRRAERAAPGTRARTRIPG